MINKWNSIDKPKINYKNKKNSQGKEIHGDWRFNRGNVKMLEEYENEQAYKNRKNRGLDNAL